MDEGYLPVAVRVYTEWRERTAREGPRLWYPPASVLVVDTETTTDAAQRLTFLSYRYLRVALMEQPAQATCVEEGLAYADELPRRDAQGLAVLHDYVADHSADVVPGMTPRLRLLSRREFVDRVLYPAMYQARATLVTFNVPFDISRIAFNVRPARGPYQGGFSFAIWEYLDEHGRLHENKYRPRLTVKSFDSKRAMKRLARPRKVEPVDVVSVESTKGADEVAVGGDVLDLRQLVYALTDKSHSLESACRVLGVPYIKRPVRHGKITTDYVDYNREDVWATVELYVHVMQEYLQCVPLP